MRISKGRRALGKATFGVVQLGGGDAQVEEHPVHGGDFQPVQHLRELGKIAVDQGDAVYVGLQALPGRGQGDLVPVQADEAAGGARAAI